MTREFTRAVFVYRGQLGIERSRIDFLLAAVCLAFDRVDVVHLSPGLGAEGSDVEAFARRFDNVDVVTSWPAGARRIVHVRSRVARLLRDETTCLIGVGFSVTHFLPHARCDVWCVNGIPEERLETMAGFRARLFVKTAWWLARLARPRRVVVVSQPMEALVRSRLDATEILVIPNAVDAGTFFTDEHTEPTYLTYLGGGSPWQGLEGLSAVWQSLHRADPSLRFRVISQDDRTRVLTIGIADDAIDLCSTADPKEVALYLREAKLGFVFRAPDLVNSVSWPMKFGEYLASGAGVVVSRCGWDIEQMVERHGCGIVVSWQDPPDVTAGIIRNYLSAVESGRPDGVRTAARELDNQDWQRVLVNALLMRYKEN